ncbi:MAG: hypothetical protein ACRC6M_13830 [Microcystaceae cyanobacterium]
MINRRWYFLVQKEGETKWRSLNSAGVWSEGNYRLAAKSDRPHLNLAIRLVYTAIASELTFSKPVTQHYRGRVNSQGFVFLSPVIHFAAGHWQLICQPIASEEVSDPNWQTSLDFEIIASKPENINYYNQPFLDIELPEVFTIPEFSSTPHQFIDLEDKSFTPELENISHTHYQIETFTTPKLFSTEAITAMTEGVSSTESAELVSLEQEHNLPPVSDSLKTEFNLSETENSCTVIKSEVKPETNAPLSATMDSVESAIAHKKEKTYIIQLQDLLNHTSVTIDIAVVDDDNHIPLNIQLPEPKLKYKLNLISQSFPPILPPKLRSMTVNKNKKKLQFTKFEPKEKVS